MLSKDEFVRISLEENLFWLRIMKEHAFFLESAMPASERKAAAEAERYKQQFEALLAACIRLADGSVSGRALQSGQYYTRYTSEAERIAQQFTGIALNRSLTAMTTDIRPVGPGAMPAASEQAVEQLNRRVLALLEGFLTYKNEVYLAQASCRMTTHLYTVILQHVLHEGQEYKKALASLQQGNLPAEEQPRGAEAFWTHIMEEHALAMRGLFDPSEEERIEIADRFTAIFASSDMDPEEETEDFRDFKANTTEGLIECGVKAMMLPLFTDHLMREANHFILMLKDRLDA